MPLCWNINKNCDVNVAITHAGYHNDYKNQKEKLQVFFILSTWPVSPAGIYETLFQMLNAASDNSEKENTICMELLN